LLKLQGAFSENTKQFLIGLATWGWELFCL